MTPEEIPATTATDILKEPRKRQTAYKLKIADIHRGVLNAQERNTHIELDGREVGRVNIIANIIDKFLSEGEKRYGALTIDDASSQIRLKVFGEETDKIKEFDIGDTILVIGNIRFYNNEIYVLPEIIKRLSTEWLLVRKLELEKIHNVIRKSGLTSAKPAAGRFANQTRQAVLSSEQKAAVSSVAFNNKTPLPVGSEKIESSPEPKSSTRDKVLEMLKQNAEGIDIDDLILSLHMPVDDINKTVTEMLEEAEIYEPKPGRIRLL